jgi:hypothetical protein
MKLNHLYVAAEEWPSVIFSQIVEGIRDEFELTSDWPQTFRLRHVHNNVQSVKLLDTLQQSKISS